MAKIIKKLSFSYCMVSITVINILFGFNAKALEAQHHSSFPHEFELHSDEPKLTEKANLVNSQISASVDSVALLMQRLNWDVNILNVPFARSLSYMDKGNAVCVVNKIQTPQRLKSYLFSLPLNFFETQKLYQVASLPPIEKSYLNDKGEVRNIHEILNSQPDSRLLKPKNYSFGQRIDSDLAKVNQQQIIPIANEAYYHSFMRMFISNRTDYAIVFPVALYQNFGDDIPIDVRAYQIEGNPAYVSGHFICSDTQQSRELISSVNTAMKTLYSDPQYIAAHTRYLPESDGEKIKNIIHQFNKEINKP
ncbi:transporter substrate-binding domain-containing protein [Aliiglaciecola litoralis]|uniref:Solute-binding protein family 3/N-terminal domain-containing protein n=1 Tax=Aliiglaciecola litoralis TaxID=582857 RepID=A0ABN1LC26_9ALTE